MADKLPLDPNIATVLGNLEFMDADGKPEKDQKAQQALLVETIKAEAARNLAGSKADITEDMVSAEVAKVAATRIGALVMGSEFAMAQNQAQAQAALTGLLNGQKYQVSNSGFIGYNAEYTNSSMGYMDRLAKKIGNTAPVLGQMYKRVKNLIRPVSSVLTRPIPRRKINQSYAQQLFALGTDGGAGYDADPCSALRRHGDGRRLCRLCGSPPDQKLQKSQQRG